VWRLSRIGIWQPSQHQTTPKISTLLGELELGRDDCAGVGLCLRAASAVHCGDGGANSW